MLPSVGRFVFPVYKTPEEGMVIMPAKKKMPVADKPEKMTTAAMRHPALYALTIIVLIVIIVAFVIGPILGGSISSGTGLVAGAYRGRNISYTAGSYFVRSYEAQYQQTQEQAQQGGKELGLQDVYGAMKTAYDSTVFRYGLLDMAERAGVYVSSQEVTETLANSPRFRDESGNFSSDLLRRTLAAEPNLRDEIREDLLFDKVQNDLINGGQVSEAEIQFIGTMGQKRRIFDLVSLSFDDYPKSELLSYLAENSQLFQRIELSSITTDSLNETSQLLERLQNRESSFEDLAESASTDIYSTDGGSRGEVWYYDIQRDFEEEGISDLLFALEEGQLSDVFQIRGEKYVIYRADSAVKQADADDPEVIEQLKNYVLSFERGRIADYFRAQAESFIALAEEIGWASASAEKGLSSVTTSEVGINYGDTPLFPTIEASSSGVLSGTSTRDALFTELFSLELGAVSTAQELRDKIVVARYAEAADREESLDDFFSLYLPYLAQDYLIAELRRQFSSPENLTDNFDTTFQEIFIQEN